MRKSECGRLKKRRWEDGEKARLRDGEVMKAELGPAVVPDERYYGAARMWKAEKIRPKNAARG